MLKELLGVKSYDELNTFGVKLLAKEGVEQFERELADSSVVFLKDDYWSHVKLKTNTSNVASVNSALRKTEAEMQTVAILHRLQMLGVCCPATSVIVNSILQKTTA